MRRLFAFVVVSVLLAPTICRAQSGDALRTEATRTYSEQGAATALPVFQRALAAYQEQKDEHGEAVTLGLIGNCYKKLGDYPKALDSLNRALEMKRRLGDRDEEGKTLNHLGLVYWEMAEYPKAIDVLKKSIAIARDLPDAKLEGSALNNLSLVYDELGNYRESLAQYEQALTLQREAKYEQGQAEALGNIGGVYLNLGHFKEASGYYEQALAIDERLKLKSALSDDVGNLASCQAGMGSNTEALENFDRALKLAIEAGSAKEEADWRRGKAAVLIRLGRYDAAREQYGLVLNSYERAGMKRELLESLSDEGSLLTTLGDLSSAEKDFQRAIALAREIGNPRGVQTNSIALAELQRRRELYDKAVATAKSAISAATAAKDDAGTSAALEVLAQIEQDRARYKEAVAYAQKAVESAKSTESALLEAHALQSVADAERAMGSFEAAERDAKLAEDRAAEFGDTELRWRSAFTRGRALEALRHLDDAVRAYRTAVDVLEDVRNQLRESRFRTGYIQDRYEPYVALVRLLLSLGRIDEAFAAGERLRSQMYLRQLSSEAGPDAAELRERIIKLQQAMEQERTKARRQQRGAAIELYSTELSEAQRKYEALLDDERARNSAVVRAAAVPVASVTSALPPKSALVDYIVGSDCLNVFVITRQGVHGLTTPLRSNDLRTRVELLRKLIANPGSDEWKPVATGLHGILLGAAEQRGWLKDVTHLYVAPHDVLHYLPFAVLRRNDGRLAVENYTLMYVPAASSLARNNSGMDSEGLLAVAPGQPELVYAAAEARRASRTFPGHSALLIGHNATETSFKRMAPHYEILHLATHGFFNRVNPMFSAIELEPDPENDGRLEVFEILNLNLHARLVTLSACETAMGSGIWSEYPAGDEFLSVTRAFLDAGSESVLATLWKVEDASTATLMGRFYGSLDSMNGDAALASAQRSLLKNPRYRHPFYWGAFVLAARGSETNEKLAKKR